MTGDRIAPNTLTAADPAVEVAVCWASVAGNTYTIERSTQLLDDFEPIATGVSAVPPENTFDDTAALGAGPFFYRLKVE